MQREFLDEDLVQIKKYFPGAQAVRLRTPFDLSRGSSTGPRLGSANFREAAPSSRFGWLKDTATTWTSWI